MEKVIHLRKGESWWCSLEGGPGAGIEVEGGGEEPVESGEDKDGGDDGGPHLHLHGCLASTWGWKGAKIARHLGSGEGLWVTKLVGSS